MYQNYFNRNYSPRGCSITILVIIILIISASRIFAQTHDERYYQLIAAKSLSGSIEYVTKDKSRIDIVTDEYAIEVDFCYHWQESIGQSLFYSLAISKKPGIVIIFKGYNDYVFLKRLSTVCNAYHIKLWSMDTSTERLSELN